MEFNPSHRQYHFHDNRVYLVQLFIHKQILIHKSFLVHLIAKLLITVWCLNLFVNQPSKWPYLNQCIILNVDYSHKCCASKLSDISVTQDMLWAKRQLCWHPVNISQNGQRFRDSIPVKCIRLNFNVKLQSVSHTFQWDIIVWCSHLLWNSSKKAVTCASKSQ